MKEESKQEYASGPQKENKDPTPLYTEGQIIIEEKQSKPNGDVNIIQYVRGNFLGKGGFAKCYEFTRVKDKIIFAGKLIAKHTLTKSRARQKLLSEIKIHRSLVHRHIVGFEHFFEDCDNVYILLELCKSQSMNELLRRRKRLHELEVQCYTVQMISALKYMHAHKVIHRDLKLGNLFLNDKMEVKIGDFGLATKLEFDGDRKRTICGTPNYIAPEILEGKQGHSYEVDVWSLGVIIYTLLIGKPPFETQDVKTTYQKIKRNQYAFPEHVKISKQAKSLVSSILQLDPQQRPSLDQILEHDFFRLGQSIPKHLPSSTLACPPSETYIRQFWPSGQSQHALGRQSSTNDLVKKGANTAADKRPLLTERTQHRGQTLSPTNNINQNQLDKRMVSNEKLQWNDQEEAFIKKWIDYSNKYGIGYILTNESCGVYFNDNSKILLRSDNFTLEYFEKNLLGENKEKQDTFTLKGYPPDLKKKVTLLIHFKNFMEGIENKSLFPQQKQTSQTSLVYVKRWLKTKHAIVFRLSNKVVQVIFEDQSELVMSSLSKRVSYLNKKGERVTYPLASALESGNQEMIKRLNYSRQVLEHSIKSQQQKQPMLASAGGMTDRIQSNPGAFADQARYSSGNSQQRRQSHNRGEEFSPVLQNKNNAQQIIQKQQQIEVIDKKRPLGTAR